MKKKEASIILLLSAIVLFIVAAVGISITSMFTKSSACAYAGDGEELPFSDDTILVVLTSEATLTFKKYTSEDFVDIGVLSVEDLSESAREKLYDQLYGDDPSQYKKNWMINKNAFRTILCLTLEHKGEEAIFNAIEKLMKREDVESAEPNYKIHPETTNPNDPYYSNQWGSNDDYGIAAPLVWEYTSGAREDNMMVDPDTEEYETNVVKEIAPVGANDIREYIVERDIEGVPLKISAEAFGLSVPEGIICRPTRPPERVVRYRKKC